MPDAELKERVADRAVPPVQTHAPPRRPAGCLICRSDDPDPALPNAVDFRPRAL